MLNININQINEMIEKDAGVEEVSSKDIAIIGMYANMPMAKDIDSFWDSLKEGSDLIRDFPKSRLKDVEDYLKYTGEYKDNLTYEKGAYFDRIDEFDHSFFRLSKKEASLMDPNQRMFMQAAWGAIEDAGYGGGRIRNSRTGVYLGFCEALHTYRSIISKAEPSSISISLPGNLVSMIASRISYLLNLKGPAMAVDTACSSSLVALHLACESIRSRKCEMALVGGVRMNLMPVVREHKFGVESSDGRAKTFDDSSDGTGQGEGNIAVLIKPLSKAIEDNDNIYAVIKGIAINQDGASMGITAPNVEAQEDVIVNALRDANVEPETISYIEAHGTGTKLGDPIEIDGLNRAFKRYTDRKQFCGIGSIKTNVGHLDNAAGIAGVLKAVLSLKHGYLPPSLHFKQPNKEIDFELSPVYVVDKLRKWETYGMPKRCCVSSFGLSGTNCHVVLEEYIEKGADREEDRAEILTISAMYKDGINEIIKAYKEKIDRGALKGSIKDICYTANTGRNHYNYRLAMIVDGVDDFKNKISYLNEKGVAKATWLKYGFYQTSLGRGKETANQLSAEDIKKLTAEADKKLNRFVSEKNNIELLEDVCSLYVNGADIDFFKHYAKEKRKKVSIPSYPYQRERCWITMPDQKAADAFNINGLINDKELPEEFRQELKSVMEKWDTEIGKGAKKNVSLDDVALEGRDDGNYTYEERILAYAWKDAFGIKTVNINDSFNDMGGDSINALHIKNIVDTFGYEIKVSDILQHESIAKTGSLIVKKSVEKSEDILEGYVPLGPSQLWLAQGFTEFHNHFNIAAVLYSKVGFDINSLQKALNRLLEHHDSLRAIFERKDDVFTQFIRKPRDGMYTVELRNYRDENNYRDLINNDINAMHKGLDIVKGPLMRLAVFKTNNGDHLFIALHHMICDGLSLRIVIEDLITAYLKIAGGGEAAFPDKTASFKTWVEKVISLSNDKMVLDRLKKWAAKNLKYVADLPYDHKVGLREHKYRAMKVVMLNSEETIKLFEVSKKIKVSVNELLLSSLFMMIKTWSGNNHVYIQNQASSRVGVDESINLTRSVGWFAMSYPLMLSSENHEAYEIIKDVKGIIAEDDAAGLQYALLERYLTDEKKKEIGLLNINVNTQVYFNYTGNYDNVNSEDVMSIGVSDIDPGRCEGEETDAGGQPLEIYASIIQNVLNIGLLYDTREYEEGTMDKVCGIYRSSLETIIGI